MERSNQHAHLIETALEGLQRTTGLTAQLLRLEQQNTLPQDQNQRFDALIEIETHGRRHQFAVEAKLGVRAELLTQIKALWPRKQQPPMIIVAPYITNYLAEKCREIKLPFLDAAGNAYLEDDDLFVFVTGPKKHRLGPSAYKSNKHLGRVEGPICYFVSSTTFMSLANL